MRKVFDIRIVIFTVLILAFSSLASAGEVGRVTYVEGRVDVFSPGSEKAVFAKEGTFINIGDSIRVKSNSKAEVTFLDNTILRIAESSKVDVADYQLDSDNNRKTATIKLERGKIRTTIKKTGDSAKFNIKTPNASGSVKESDIYTYFQGGNSGMIVVEGALTVFSTAHPESVLNVPAGSAVVIPLKEAPKGPREYMDIEKKLHEQDTSIPYNISSRKTTSLLKARIIKFTGDVKITSGGSNDAHAAAIGEIVSEGDKIVTGADGVVEISFDNGNAIYLKPNTDIAILRLVFDAKSGERENMFQSYSGKIKARIEKQEGKSKFEIKTPTAVCGARGTIMYLSIASDGITQVYFEGGNGYFTNLISGRTMEVAAGGGAVSDVSGGITEAAAESGSDIAEDWGPGGGVSGYASADGASENYPHNSDTSANAAYLSSQASDNATGNDGLDGGQVDVPITVADPGAMKGAAEDTKPANTTDENQSLGST